MTSLSKLTRFTALAGGVALFVAAVSPILGSGGASLQIDGILIQGNVVRITVSNPTDDAASGTVLARMLLGTGPTQVGSPVHVPAGQKVFVDFTAPAPVEGVLQAGVVLDDGSPF